MAKTRQWAIVTAVVVVVVLAAGWFLLVKPQQSKAADLHTQTDAQVQQNQLLLTQISALQAEQKDLPKQQLLLQKFATEVPDNAAEPTLIRQLSAAAEGAGVDLTTITPGAPASVAPAAVGTSLTPTAAAPGVYQLPLSLVATGSYANVESFFNALERLPRALLVTGFSLAPATNAGTRASGGTSGTDQLSASLSGAVFYAPPATPPASTGTQTLTPTTGTTPAPSSSPTPTSSTSGS